MQWIRSHRYAIALIATAVLAVVGGVIAKNDWSGIPAEPGDAVNVSVAYPYYAPPENIELGPANVARRIQQNAMSDTGSSTQSFGFFFDRTPKPKYIPPIAVTPSPTMKTPVKEKGPAVTQDTSLNGQYLSFFRALSNILSPIDTRTPEQKVLFAYGNEIGSIIKNFEDTHGDTSKILKTFFDIRTDPSKAAGIPEIAAKHAQLTALSGDTNPSVSDASAVAGVQEVADEYAQLGARIASLQNIPPEAETPNTKLARGYADVAQGLSRLTKAENDQQLLEAVNAYNASADEFIRNYVTLVQLFSAYGVKFSASDAGAIFSFSATGGL